jgi:cephalosporin-C deacetylase-like acetyl esterase
MGYGETQIDKSSISVLGISYGSFIAEIAMALDKRINQGVLVESGGNSDKITRYSFLLRRIYKIDIEEYTRNQLEYNNYLRDVSMYGGLTLLRQIQLLN